MVSCYLWYPVTYSTLLPMVSCYLWYPDTCGIHGKDKGEGKGKGKGKGTGSMGMGKGMGMGMGKGENGWQGERRERKGSDRSTRLTFFDTSPIWQHT
jgi:hypothetical protein